MKFVGAVFSAIAFTMGVLMMTSSHGVADEAVRITGEIKELNIEGTPLQLIPTDKGMFVVVGKLSKDKPANLVLLEGAKGVQVRVAAHTHTQTLVIHCELEEQLRESTERNAWTQNN